VRRASAMPPAVQHIEYSSLKCHLMKQRSHHSEFSLESETSIHPDRTRRRQHYRWMHVYAQRLQRSCTCEAPSQTDCGGRSMSHSRQLSGGKAPAQVTPQLRTVYKRMRDRLPLIIVGHTHGTRHREDVYPISWKVSEADEIRLYQPLTETAHVEL
jgi:hypothetical protein